MLDAPQEGDKQNSKAINKTWVTIKQNNTRIEIKHYT